jgi:UDP-N-acetylmuramate--alanine ligase
VTRSASEIGAGLAPARQARPIRPGERIHALGVAGAGASAAALLALHAGAHVTGCDPGGASQYTEALEAAGIAINWRHDARHVRGAAGERPERLAVTKALTAVKPDHAELRAARELEIPTEPWQQVVADAAAGRRLVAVAGTHGKSTTAGWLTHLLVSAGNEPSAFVGALLPESLTGGPPATARWGYGEVFVVEADEYAGNFDAYRPDVALLTNIDWDHPDVFPNREAVVGAFEDWLTNAPEQAVIVANIGDPGVRELVERMPRSSRSIVRVALADDAADQAEVLGRITSSDPRGTDFAIENLVDGASIAVRLPTVGRHNVANALVVAAAARTLGVAPAAIAAGLASCPGVGRRLERKGEAGGVVVYDDYGHHPTAIRATLEALRQREPGRRVWAVYEPLTFHRTAAMLGAFADALSTADAVAIAAIWPGRDRDRTVASAAGLAQAIARRTPQIPIAAPGSVEETASWLAGQVQPNDAVLVMGGGRSYRIAGLLLEQLERG